MEWKLEGSSVCLLGSMWSVLCRRLEINCRGALNPVLILVWGNSTCLKMHHTELINLGTSYPFGGRVRGMECGEIEGRLGRMEVLGGWKEGWAGGYKNTSIILIIIQLFLPLICPTNVRILRLWIRPSMSYRKFWDGIIVCLAISI